MDPDELDEAVQALQDVQRTLRADYDRLRVEHDKTARAFDQLSQKLRHPGTKFLVDLEYKLVYEGTTTVGAGAVVVTPTPFETLPGRLHAIYVLSAYPIEATKLVITDGSVTTANIVTVAIQREEKATPTRVEMSVCFDNSGGVDVNVAVRVWRRLGMGS